MCYKQAKAAEISGTFRAVLASRQQTIESLVFHKDQDLAVVNGHVSTKLGQVLSTNQGSL